MIELLQEAILPINMLLTLMFGVILVYWVLVIVGALEIDFLNVDFDIDVDVEGGEVNTGDLGAEGFFATFMAFFHAGRVPTMVLLSVLITSMWLIAIVSNYYLNFNRSFLIALPLLVGNLIASLFVVKVCAAPLGRMFKYLYHDADSPKNVTGRLGEVISPTVSKEMGQIKVNTNGAPVILNAITEGDVVLNQGDEAVVLEFNKEQNVYIIAPVER